MGWVGIFVVSRRACAAPHLFPQLLITYLRHPKMWRQTQVRGDATLAHSCEFGWYCNLRKWLELKLGLHVISLPVITWNQRMTLFVAEIHMLAFVILEKLLTEAQEGGWCSWTELKLYALGGRGSSEVSAIQPMKNMQVFPMWEWIQHCSTESP